VLYFAFFAWSILDTEPSQPVWAVAQKMLSSMKR